MLIKNRKGFRKITSIYLFCLVFLGGIQAMEGDDGNWAPRTAKDFASRKGQEYLKELERELLRENKIKRILEETEEERMKNYETAQNAWKYEKLKNKRNK